MTSTCWSTSTQTLKVTRIGSHVSGESDGMARSLRWSLSHLSGDSLDESSDHAAEQMHTMKRQVQFFFLTGWLIPVGVVLVFFGRWITEIVVPTLKGGNFDQLYDLHRVRLPRHDVGLCH